jgi:trimethylamine:corrinoid methyltransferase-like protein
MDGGSDAWSRAKEAARSILATYEPEPLDREVDAWIKEQFTDTLVPDS